MTGYGKAVVAYKDKKINVEVKSLNSKQLDLQTRIAPLYREKEMEHDSKDLATRYLMKDEELLKTADDVRFAVCNQWGSYNIPNIFRVMEKWG